ncbi:enhancer of split m8 protein-like [Gigantopelta aegis]|uniref:enhancer of split m8 protein-like n=1 Tax=Gigantopelta aegis TaxID=1735272 RepID=UPI001B88C491|nr:enhancer of split m8 protein-like [Gigantopelta aegis]
MAPRYERRRQKPLTERKRRARINKCLEVLKDVVIDNNGGILPRLDKARILELTVSYLKTMVHSKPKETLDKEKFTAGYLRCLDEVTSYLQERTDNYTLNRVIQHLFTKNIQFTEKAELFHEDCIIEQESKTPLVSNSNSVHKIGPTLNKRMSDTQQHEYVLNNPFPDNGQCVIKNNGSDDSDPSNNGSKSTTTCETLYENIKDSSSNEKDCNKMIMERSVNKGHLANGRLSSQKYDCVNETIRCNIAASHMLWRPW